MIFSNKPLFNIAHFRRKQMDVFDSNGNTIFLLKKYCSIWNFYCKQVFDISFFVDAINCTNELICTLCFRIALYVACFWKFWHLKSSFLRQNFLDKYNVLCFPNPQGFTMENTKQRLLNIAQFQNRGIFNFVVTGKLYKM